ncbi:sensor histidine kinase [Oricola thermophila]|uniref:histidine kinase n=1 Tax=Oricola thermophila TaxID=2742145 RepID=A0A6N1VE96_9HYPH|nr:HAMP domain-containing sensor histidine kinase [Oricola thermophila]QKV19256.1 HAMP domain-containing histidine kinase [Oricola thermophila]
MIRPFARRSLRLRLMAFAAGIMAVTLIVAGFGLTALFARNLERRVGQELDTHVAQIAGALRFSPDGEISLAREPADPRFNRVFGGLYWQVTDTGTGASLRSRSLWDTELALPDDLLAPGVVHVHEIAGPRGSSLLVHEQAVVVDAGATDRRIRLSVAIDTRELDELRAGFARDIAPALVVAGLVLLIGFAVQIRAGLQPMDTLRAAIADIRAGRRKRLDGAVPSEVAPLVEEVNTLLDHQEAAMLRARDRAADLAHGLKTPLTALAADARKLRDLGAAEIADDIDELAGRMRVHVEREMARARLRHGAAAPAVALAPAAAAIVRALERTPAAEGKQVAADVPPDLAARVDSDDFNEILGNLAENAVRHAASRVLISARRDGDIVRIAVEDDGPGVDEERRAEILRRGRRLDEGGRGAAGLGLAIVGDILAETGGRLDLGTSRLGGLSATVELKA